MPSNAKKKRKEKKKVGQIRLLILNVCVIPKKHKLGPCLESRGLYENGGMKSVLAETVGTSPFSFFLPTFFARGGNLGGANPVIEARRIPIATAAASPWCTREPQKHTK